MLNRIALAPSPIRIASSKTLNETLTADGVAAHLDYTMVPFGNAYYNTTKCGTGSYDKQHGMFCWISQCGGDNPPAECFDASVAPLMCQHGPDECYANTLESCAIHLNGGSASPAVLDFIYLYEGLNEGRKPAAPKCAAAAGLDFDALNKCATGAVGEALMVANAKKTIALGPSKLGTPWVLVNGVVLQDATTLLEAVCAKMKGTKPAGCSSAHVNAALSRTAGTSTMC
jgi:interferon gamma-inducible protein 30